jgi:hypothetical protein
MFQNSTTSTTTQDIMGMWFNENIVPVCRYGSRMTTFCHSTSLFLDSLDNRHLSSLLSFNNNSNNKKCCQQKQEHTVHDCKSNSNHGTIMIIISGENYTVFTVGHTSYKCQSHLFCFFDLRAVSSTIKQDNIHRIREHHRRKFARRILLLLL